MAQIQPPTSAPPVNNTAAPASVTPVETTVASLPDKIAQLLRQIQVSGTVAQPPDAGTITLNTAVGPLVLILPQLAQEEKQKLIQILIQLFQSQRPLTVVVQPGASPAQAFLLLPNQPATAPQQNILDTISLTQTAARPTQPLSVGLSLPAVVLPAATPIPSSANLPPPLPPQITAALTASLLETEINLPTTILTQVAQQAIQNVVAELPVLVALKAEAAALPVQNISAANIPALNVPVSNPAQAASPNILQPTVPASTNAQPAIPVSANVPLSNLVTTAIPVQTVPQAAPSVLNVPGSSLPALLQAGNEVILNVNAISLPSEPKPVAATANQIVATVVGNGPNGQLILKSSDAVLYIKQSIAAPIGANVLISVDAAKPALVSLTDTQSFPALQQMLSALAQADPQIAQQFVQANIPQPNAQLPGVLLFLMSAFKQGDARNWLGNNAADILSHLGKIELAAKFMNEMAPPGMLVRDSAVGEWRPYQIPLQAEGRLHMLNLYVHSETQGQHTRDGGHQGPAQVRFLIDMRMSRLGAIQLDGLVQPKKLDMIVRSENSLPAGLPNELRDTYIRTLGALGYNGALGFQTGRKHWLVIQQDTQKSIMT